MDEKVKLEQQIAAAPPGTLYFGKNRAKGKCYYKWYVANNRAGQRAKKSYLSRSERPTARKLARKALLQARLKDTDLELAALDAYWSKHCASSFWKKVLQSPGLRELIPEETQQAPPGLAEELERWAHEEYETNIAFPEQKNIQTDQGIMVRSKSEAIILTLLAMYRIPFRYECRLDVGGHVYYPDFTIRHPLTGEYYYWEHVGMLDHAGYRADFLSKMRVYFNNGILPDHNLILTYESDGHPLDISIVMDKLKEFFFCNNMAMF